MPGCLSSRTAVSGCRSTSGRWWWCLGSSLRAAVTLRSGSPSTAFSTASTKHSTGSITKTRLETTGWVWQNLKGQFCHLTASSPFKPFKLLQVIYFLYLLLQKYDKIWSEMWWRYVILLMRAWTVNTFIYCYYSRFFKFRFWISVTGQCILFFMFHLQYTLVQINVFIDNLI